MKAVCVYTESRVPPPPKGQGRAGGTFCSVVMGKRLGASQERLRFVRRDRRHPRAPRGAAGGPTCLREWSDPFSCFELPSLQTLPRLRLGTKPPD